MKQFAVTAAAILWITCILSPSLRATTITQTYSGSFPGTISGTLPDQSAALLETLNLPSNSDLTVTTTSYATGGFETSLLLFNSMGNFVAAGVPFGMADPNTGTVGDSQLTASDLSGMYTLAVTDFLLNQSFTATNLSDGFTANYGSGTTFVDANGNTRTGAYAITVSTSAAAPEPSTILFAAPLLVAIAAWARKRCQVA
jgi:hypothetical protein